VKIRLRDNSGTRIYRYLSEEVDRHGNVRVYFRCKVGQRRIRLRETPGTEAFDKEYQRAFRGDTRQPAATAKRVAPASLGWLCQQYYASAEFQELANSTQTVRRGILGGICDRRIEDERVGDWPYADIEPRDVRRLRDEKKAFPDAANNLVKTVRQLFAWACLGDVGLAETNPALDVGRLKPHNPDGIRAWTEAGALRYEARHPIGTVRGALQMTASRLLGQVTQERNGGNELRDGIRQRERAQAESRRLTGRRNE
jgi:hypothetical protein